MIIGALSIERKMFFVWRYSYDNNGVESYIVTAAKIHIDHSRSERVVA